MMSMSKFRYSEQVYSYVPKQLKQRLLALREIDPKRFSESGVIETCLLRVLPEIEKEAELFKGPTQGAPGRKKTAA
jgi:hypothetical protein